MLSQIFLLLLLPILSRCVAFVIEFMLDHGECQEALRLTYYNRQMCVDRAGIFEFKDRCNSIATALCPF